MLNVNVKLQLSSQMVQYAKLHSPLRALPIAVSLSLSQFHVVGQGWESQLVPSWDHCLSKYSSSQVYLYSTARRALNRPLPGMTARNTPSC